MQSPQLSLLIAQYLEGNLPEAGLEELRTQLTTDASAEEVQKSLEVLLQQTEPDPNYDEGAWTAMVQNIMAVDRIATPEITKAQAPSHRIHFLKTSWFRYAAAVFLLVAMGLAVRTIYQKQQWASIARRIEKSRNNDAPPGGNKAVLRLANGTTIVLDSAANGQLASQGNVQILKLQNGQLKFVISQSEDTNNTTASQINTITTPRGGQYQVELPDGTQIWLNAATTFRFPTRFIGSKRQVQLAGEAYFEVAKDASHPFEVAANNTTVAVLGTHFNVNAYPNEKAVTTTLLEGKVQVQAGGDKADLWPGYQCQSGNGGIRVNTHANTEEAVAWKNGQFQFSGADVASILRQVSRWYSVEVNYIGDVPSAHITGEIPRTLTLQQVMEVLRESGISLWLEENKQLYVASGQ